MLSRSSEVTFIVTYSGKMMFNSNQCYDNNSRPVFLTFNCASSDSVFITKLWRVTSLARSFAISDFWYATRFCTPFRNRDCLSNSCLLDSNDCCSSDTSDFHLSKHQWAMACCTEKFCINFYNESVNCILNKQALLYFFCGSAHSTTTGQEQQSQLYK